MLIPDKSTYLKLSRANKLGNTLQVWDNYNSIPNSYKGFVTIRNRVKDSPFFVPNISIDAIPSKLKSLQSKGLNPNTVYFQEVPHQSTCVNLKCEGCGRVLNGEAMRDEAYINLTYGSSPNLNLRTDLNINGKIATKLTSVLYLKQFYDCYEDLNEIWDDYPDSIIEFSVFTRNVGILDKNTIIWEVRNY